MNSKKTSSRIWGIGLITGLLLILAFQQLQVLIIDESPLQSNPDSLDVRFSYTTHDPIDIMDDSGFEAVKSSGEGNDTHPYVIEGLNITLNATSSPIGIAISGTNAHFIIRNCLIITSQPGETGIYIYNVANGTATIINNTCTGYGAEGIYISYSDSVNIHNNTCSYNNGYGIYVDTSHNSTIINNTCTFNYYSGLSCYAATAAQIINNTCNDNREAGMNIGGSSASIIENNTCLGSRWGGIMMYNCPSTNISYNNCNGETAIEIYDSNNCILTNNTCSDSETGIYIGYSVSSVIANNAFVNCGLRFSSLLKEELFTQIVTENIVNGLPLGFLVNKTDLTITESYGQLILINCNSTVVSHQNYSNTSIGIALFYCNDCEISNNVCNNIGRDGIALRDSNSTNVTNNICNNVYSDGIELDDSPNAYIYNNTCSNVYGDGIELDASPNAYIYNNTCINSYNDGIDIDESPFSSIINNTFWSSGLRLSLYTKEEYSTYTVTTNTVNGLPLGYFAGQTDLTITESYGQLILINCNITSIKNQNYSNSSTGISLLYCNVSEIVNNICNNGYLGIRVLESAYINISDNICINNIDRGILVVDVPYSNVLNNICNENGIFLEDDSSPGIYIYNAPNSTIFNNTCNHNGVGMSIESLEFSIIANNTCNNNDYAGINFWDIYFSQVANNTCIANGWKDIEEDRDERSGIDGYYLVNNTFYQNSLFRNAGYGIHLGSGCFDNTFYLNNFGANGDGTTLQAYCHESGNQWNITSVGNYWSDYNGSGSYPIDFYASYHSFDYFPMLLAHFFTPPALIYPTGGETLSGIVTIQWKAATDSLWYPVTYIISYTRDGGVTWTNLTTDYTGTSYIWDTRTVVNSSNCLLEVVVVYSNGSSDGSMVGSPFTIANTAHSLSTPNIISPNGGETISGIKSIQWTAATDSWGHPVSYTVAYSVDGGNIWINLIIAYTSISFDWDTTTVTDGANYLIRIIAICDIGLSAEDTSDSTFTISNVATTPTTTPTTTTTPAITTTPTTESTSHTTTTEPSPANFPGITSILLILSFLVVYNRKRKKT
ncbi:MAG: right-handed parallel beta-helix repeat-containing protein [Candidatus Hodarchaeales archaeon]